MVDKEVRMKRGGELDKLKRLVTQSGFEAKPFYRPEDIPQVDYDREVGDPGKFPYTRGRFEDGYRKRLWLRSMIAGFSTSEESKERYQFLIDQCEATGIRVAPDYPAQMGLDPDHPLAKWDVGAAGPPQYCLPQFEKIFEGVSLLGGGIDSASGPPWGSVTFYAQLLALAEKRGLDTRELRGSMVNDSLHCYICELSLTQPLEVGWKIQLDAMEYAAKATPAFSSCAPCGYDLRESGADTVEEVAIGLAMRTAYIDALITRGIPFEKISPRVVMVFAADIDFFETVCKLRAARRMWAKIATKRYGVSETAPGICPPVNMTCSAWTTRGQQPILNVARNTVEMLASIMAGCQALGARPYDEPLWLPTIEAHALNAQLHQLIARETGIPLVNDPLGGSYYVETLTNEIEAKASTYMAGIEEKGGIYEAARKGWLREELHRHSVEREQEYDRGERIAVGANFLKLPRDLELSIPEFKIENKLVKMQKIIEDCRLFKASRDITPLARELTNLYQVAHNGDNIFPTIIEAFKVQATQGEVLGVIREGMGFAFDHFNLVKRPDFLKYS